MPWSGGGVFSRAYSWVQDALASIDITASRMDGEFDNFATGLNDCVTKDGQNSATANLPMGNNRHTGVGNAVARSDYAAAGQLQDGAIIWCGTSSGSANAQTLTPSPAITAYAAGQVFRCLIGFLNTGAATLQISGLASPKAIKLLDGSALLGGELQVGALQEFIYDGTNMLLARPFTARGTFVPTITFGSGSTTYTTQYGVWERFGSLLWFQITVTTNAVSTPSGTVSVGTLPKAAQTAAGQTVPVSVRMAGTAVTGLVNPFFYQAFIGSGAAVVSVEAIDTSGAGLNIGSTFGNGDTVQLSGIYRTDV